MTGESDQFITKATHPKKTFPHLIQYLKLARFDHWFKHIFIISGFIIAYIAVPTHQANLPVLFCLGIISASFICSANYIINEWFDREFDQFHPRKKSRSSVVNNLKPRYVFTEYVLFAIIGLALSYSVSFLFFISNCALLIMGGIYNIKPLRTKEIPYVDVLSESVNIPIRLLLGWFIVTASVLPPPILILAYWMGGAFLMATKRFSELLFIKDKNMAGLYRSSFKYYSTEKLLISAFFYALNCAIFSAVFLIGLNPELVMTFPFYALLFAWYFKIAFKPDSIAQHPEYIFREKYFFIFAILLTVVTVYLLYNHPTIHTTLFKKYLFERYNV